MYSCANCSAIAEYTYRLNDTEMLHFCDKHLPPFLFKKKLAGLLPLELPPVVEEKPSKKKKEEAVAEPVLEETVEEPTDADS